MPAKFKGILVTSLCSKLFITDNVQKPNSITTFGTSSEVQPHMNLNDGETLLHTCEVIYVSKKMLTLQVLQLQPETLIVSLNMTKDTIFAASTVSLLNEGKCALSLLYSYYTSNNLQNVKGAFLFQFA